MACREYEDELRELAAGGLAPVREAHVRAHVVGCAACRKALEDEKRLFAIVDAALREEINAEAPASLAARIRIAAEAKEERPHVAWWRWAAVAGSVVAVGMVIAVMLTRREGPRARSNSPAETPIVVEKTPNPPVIPQTTAPRRKREAIVERVVKRRREQGGSVGPEVLVQAEEERALRQFITMRGLIREGKDVTRETDQAPKIAPIEMTELKVKPLQEVTSEGGGER